jgi:hypothetical protein
MNVFERHGITHLSASSLGLYRDQPAAWVCRYLLRVKDDAGPGAWRGTAVEAGTNQYLFGQPENATNAMHVAFEERAAGLADDKTVKERQALPMFLAQAREALEPHGTPLTRQSKISIDIPGLAVPIIGYSDWTWADVGRDLKTTWALPSNPKPKHIDQMAIYNHATGKPFELVYVTPKKNATYPISSEQAAEGMARVRRGALAIQHMLGKVDSGEDALRLFTPDYSSYLWSPELMVAANEIYNGATT